MLESLFPPLTPLRQKITCVDGFTVSVQASETHYCSPQSDTGPWTSYEVGFPSQPVPRLKEYEDGEGSGIFGWVPKDVVKEMLQAHGGPATATDLGVVHSLGLGSDV